jgi:hypothetical protein
VVRSFDDTSVYRRFGGRGRLAVCDKAAVAPQQVRQAVDRARGGVVIEGGRRPRRSHGEKDEGILSHGRVSM